MEQRDRDIEDREKGRYSGRPRWHDMVNEYTGTARVLKVVV